MTTRSTAIFRLSIMAIPLILAVLSLLRPFDHDESQYVAATILAAHGLPYRDFAYMQTPLQPMLLAPVALLAGSFAYPALRVVNALLGAVTIGAVYAAARAAGAGQRAAWLGALMLGLTDILLFSAAVARNDALPAALLALALVPIVHGSAGRATRRGMALAGLCLAAAAAAKISYALPAGALGVAALIDRRLKPQWILAGAAPVLGLVGWLCWQAPGAFYFEVFRFPTVAPGLYYHAVHQDWKMTPWAKAVDTLKFLALGPALPAIFILARRGREQPWRAQAIDALIVAGLFAALLPQPTWRQYLLTLLPPLFVRLATLLDRVPLNRAGRVSMVVFAFSGLSLSVESIIRAIAGGTPMGNSMAAGQALGRALDKSGVRGPVATLSPQFLVASGRLPDARFAPGPFYFRGANMLTLDQEQAYHLASAGTIDAHFAGGGAPAAIVVGGEDQWTSGDAASDKPLEQWALRHRWRHVTDAGPLRLYLPPR